MNGDDLIQDAVEAHERAMAAREEADRLTEERNQAVARALDAGAGAVPLADALGLTRARIYHMAARR